MSGPLAGLRVVDLSNTLTSATSAASSPTSAPTSIDVEPPGGSPLRTQPAFPFWGRGKQSIVLDFHDADDAARRPRPRERRRRRDRDVPARRRRAPRPGLRRPRARQPRAWSTRRSPRSGAPVPLAGVKGYEGLVMARLGGHAAMGVIIERPGPAFCARAVHRVERRADRAPRHPRRALRARAQRPRPAHRHDAGPGLRRPRHLEHDHPPHRPPVPGGVHPGGAGRRGRVGAQQLAVLPLAGRAVGRRSLDAVLADHAPAVLRVHARARARLDVRRSRSGRSVPDFDDIEQRTEYFERMLAAVRAKTAAEWQEVFDREPDVWAEIFRHGSELLDAPADGARPSGRDRRRHRRAARCVQPGPDGAPDGDARRDRAVGGRRSTQHGATLRSTSRPPAPATVCSAVRPRSRPTTRRRSPASP